MQKFRVRSGGMSEIDSSNLACEHNFRQRAAINPVRRSGNRPRRASMTRPRARISASRRQASPRARAVGSSFPTKAAPLGPPTQAIGHTHTHNTLVFTSLTRPEAGRTPTQNTKISLHSPQRHHHISSISATIHNDTPERLLVPLSPQDTSLRTATPLNAPGHSGRLICTDTRVDA